MEPGWTRFLPDFLRARLEGRHNLQKVISNAGWLSLAHMLRMGVGLLVGVWIARYLGPDQYGQLSYAVAFVTLFSSLGNLGLDGIAIRSIVRDASKKDDILGTVFVLKLAGGATALTASLAAIILLRPADAMTQWLVGISAAGMIFQAFDTIDFWFQSQVQSKYTAIAKSTVLLLFSVVKIVLVAAKAPLIAFAWTGLAEIAFGALGLTIAYRTSRHYLRAWRASLSFARLLLTDSWPLIFSGIVSMIYLRIDQVMLGEMVGSAEVGIYSVAVRLAEVWNFVPMAIFSSVYPSIVESKAVSDELFYERLQKLYNIMAFIGYLIAVPVTILSGWLVGSLFGPAYERAETMLAILIWAGIFTNLGVARSTFLMTMNWTRVHFLTVLMGCLINVALNYILIPRYGGMGAVIASCVAYWFATHGSCFVYRPLRRTGIMLTKAIVFPKVW
jgi:O-antigen/teichoic acid export membrane protein